MIKSQSSARYACDAKARWLIQMRIARNLMNSYYKRDVAAKKAEILAAVPDAQIETWQDYGFRLTVVRSDGAMTVMQPAREENGQEFINRPAADAIRFLRGRSI
jgi:hypothetical protein